MAEHLELVHNATVAIGEVFGDTSVGRDVTRESLDELVSLLESYLDTFEEEDGG